MNAAADLVLRKARAAGVEDVAEAVLEGRRLDREAGLRLFRCEDLSVVTALADGVRRSLHGDVAYFNVNQHINYTNLCNKGCRFCAFQRLPGQDGAYVMSPNDVAAEIRRRRRRWAT